MLKRLQRRFILSAMAAFGTVMLVIVIGINGVNYVQTASKQDEMIGNLLVYEQKILQEPKAPPPPMRDMPGGGPEAEFTTRFFAVHCDAEWNIEFI